MIPLLDDRDIAFQRLVREHCARRERQVNVDQVCLRIEHPIDPEYSARDRRTTIET